jgi:hypothetical protein
VVVGAVRNIEALAGERRIRFTDGGDEIGDSRIEPGGFLTAWLRDSFGSLPLGD